MDIICSARDVIITDAGIHASNMVPATTNLTHMWLNGHIVQMNGINIVL